MPYTGFEDQESHQAPSTPAGTLSVYASAARGVKAKWRQYHKAT